MPNFVTQLSTPRLRLRTLEPSDAEEVQHLLATNKHYMIPWVPWAGDEPETVEEKKAKIRSWEGEFYLDKKYVYGFFDKESDRLVGLGFFFSRQGDGILEIGYIVDHAETGKGYATETSYAITKLGFEHIGIEKIVIICNEANAASARVPEKLGYLLESRQRFVKPEADGSRQVDLVWAMYREDFKAIAAFEPVGWIEET